MSTLYLAGAGNSEGVRLARRVCAHRGDIDRIVLLDDDASLTGRDRMGTPIIGPLDLLAGADSARDRVANLVARTTRGRAAVRTRLLDYGIPFLPLVDPTVDTDGATLPDDDITVYANATIGPETVLGPGCVVFMGAVVGHESRVSEGCVIASNAVLNARVILNERVYIGTNATVLPELEVGRDATVGAGSVAMSAVPAEATVVGVPAVRVDQPPADRPALADCRAVITEAWARALGTAPPAHANFFDAGGTSLKSVQVASEIAAALGVTCTPLDIFRAPTVERLATLLAGEPGEAEAPRSRFAAQRASLERRLEARRGH